MSYSTVRSIVTALDPAMLALAHDGAVAFRDTYELVYRRRAERPNAMWQADHTQLDVLVLDAGRPRRPWLTVILDDCSRAVAGYTVTLGAPSALNTSLALRQAIWTKPEPGWPMCEIPDVLYVDHGSDFTSNHLTQVAADLKFQRGPRQETDKDIYAALARSRALFYTPTVSCTLRELRNDLELLHSHINICVDQHVETRGHARRQILDYTALIVIDESERLSATAIEHLREQYDHGDHGLLFIGMPGIEETFSRYPQLYSRVGFAHHYRPLSGEELTFVLNRHWRKLGPQLDPDDFTDAQAIADGREPITGSPSQ